MYFPYLRSKQEELNAIRELRNEINVNSRFIPIIEPIGIRRYLFPALRVFGQCNMKFGMILNPFVGEYSNNFNPVLNRIAQYCVDNCGNNWFPAILISRETSPIQINQISNWIVARIPNASWIIVYTDEPDVNVRNALGNLNVSYNFVFRNVPQRFDQTLFAATKIHVIDSFIRRNRNADYPSEEPFSDNHLLIPNANYVGFSDYSIVGNYYSEGGGAAHAVALHHVYFDGGTTAPLRIQHHLSIRRQGSGDTPGKFLEALQSLVASINTMQPYNITQTAQEYININNNQRFPGLAYAKRLAMKHHFELMLDVI